jgi:hypothetical protein
MTIAKCLRCVVLFVAVTSHALLGEEPASEDVTATHPAVVKTIEQWEQRRKALDTLKILIDGESKEEILPGATDEQGHKLIPGVVQLPIQTTWYLDLRNGWYRREQHTLAHNPIDNSRTPRIDISLWDGEHYKLFSRVPQAREFRGEHAEESNQKRKVSIVGSFGGDAKKSALIYLDDDPLFFSLGYIKWSDQDFSDMLTLKLNDGDFLRVRDWKPGQQEPFVLVRRDRKPGIIHEYTIDPEKGGAITHFRSSVDPSSKTLYFGWQVHTIETKFQKTDFGWFPASWTLQMGEKPHVQSVSTHKVVELKFNPKLDRSLFQIEEEGDQKQPSKN